MLNPVVPAAAAAILFLAPTLTASVVTVGKRCPGARAYTLPQALDMAQAGDDVRLCPGAYTVPAEGLAVNKTGVRIASFGPAGSVKVKPERKPPQGSRAAAFIVAAGGVQIEGLDIRGFSGPGILVESGTEGAPVILKLNRVHHNRVGIELRPGAHTLLLHNSVFGNLEHGILIDAAGKSRAEVIGNTVVNNSAGPGFTAGIEVRNAGGTVLIAHNECRGNAVGLRLKASSGVAVEDNDLSRNRLGLDLVSASDNRIRENRINDNTRLAGVWIRSQSARNQFHHNEATRNRHDGIFVLNDGSTRNEFTNNRLAGNLLHGLHLSTAPIRPPGVAASGVNSDK